VAGAVLQTLEVPVTEGFWVHLDADVLDPSAMPAVDSPEPGGLLPDELAPLLRTLVRSERCVGFRRLLRGPPRRSSPEGRHMTVPWIPWWSAAR
jgi:arginase